MEEKYRGPERRTSTRLYKKVSVDYIFINGVLQRDLSKRYSGYVSNFSYSGALLELDELNENWIKDLTSGMIKIIIEIKIPVYPEPIKAIAKVIWIKRNEEPEKEGKYLIGLSFTDITDEDRDRIKKYTIESYVASWKAYEKEIKDKNA
ncbi:MAG: PilZ domain-containing protein [Candidatus Omnitrophota bacterium]